jgi:hypothetical protein
MSLIGTPSVRSPITVATVRTARDNPVGRAVARGVRPRCEGIAGGMRGGLPRRDETASKTSAGSPRGDNAQPEDRLVLRSM